MDAVASIFALLGLALRVPDQTTLSRCGRSLRLDLRADAGRGIHLAIDSTGLRLARPSGAGRKGWRKSHIAVDPATGLIRTGELTRSDVHDTRPASAMLGRIAGRLGRACVDGAYAGEPNDPKMLQMSLCSTGQRTPAFIRVAAPPV